MRTSSKRPGTKSMPKFIPRIKNPAIPKRIKTELKTAQAGNALLNFFTVFII